MACIAVGKVVCERKEYFIFILVHIFQHKIDIFFYFQTIGCGKGLMYSGDRKIIVLRTKQLVLM